MERIKVKKVKKITKYIVSKKLDKAFAYLESKAALANKNRQKHFHGVPELRPDAQIPRGFW